jgi:hypothetical protein
MTPVEPFRFYTESHFAELTGLNVSNLPQLPATLREVPGSSVFYHTHQWFLSHHFEKPVVYNNFAVWVGEALREDAPSEKLAPTDTLAFTSARQLREAVVHENGEAGLRDRRQLRVRSRSHEHRALSPFRWRQDADGCGEFSRADREVRQCLGIREAQVTNPDFCRILQFCSRSYLTPLSCIGLRWQVSFKRERVYFPFLYSIRLMAAVS